MIPTSTLHLFDQLMGPACLVDDAGVILAANPAFAELVERPSAVGLLLSDLLAREPGAVDRCLEAWLRQPELWPCPFETAPARRQVIAHGALIDPEARLVLVRLALKETDRFGLRDSRLQSVGEEAGLRRASQEAAHLRAVLSAAPDAVVVIGEEGRIEAFNPAAQAMFGYTLPDVLGRNVSLLMPDPPRSEHDGYLARYLRTGEAKIIGGPGREAIALRKDGSEFPCRLAISEAVVKGGQRVFTGWIQDLSERERRAEQLERREREVQHLQRLEAVGRLASGVAHEYRNLLMGIQGCASLALEAIAQRGDAAALGDVQVHVQEIATAAARGTSLAGQLLSFSRPHAEDLEPVEVDGSLGNVERLLRGLLGEDVELVIERFAPSARVLAGEGWLEQVLLNLAVNARDAMPHGGRLLLRSRVTEDAQGAREVLIEVTDSGTGIAAEDRERIFEPFYTTKSERHGTGLGLSTVHGLVRQMGGRIELDSELGAGATFRACLPQHLGTPSSRPLPAPRSNAPPPAQEATVLVVEDEPLVLLTVDHYLRRAGYTPILTRSPDEALRECERRTGPIDLLLTDVSLPGRSGPELAAEVREQRPQIAVLYMSAYSRAHLVSEGKIEPSAPTIEKPFSEEALASKLTELLAPAASLTPRER